MEKQPMTLWQIWNMSFGFLGIQFGWGLQMANMSAIYQYLGASESAIALLWLAAPLTGLFVQPIVGYYSDRTWTKLGRRRPFFLVGAIFASLALIAMPNSSALWMAAGLLWILDASVNVSMEPFRAFVGDLLPEDLRKTGFAMQSLLIGAGAMAASAMPWILTNWFGFDGSTNAASKIPITLHISFYVGAVVLFLAVLYTIIKTPEKPPEDMEAFQAMKRETAGVSNAFKEIVQGIFAMPKGMQKISAVQFFTWFALFCLWTSFTPAISIYIFGGQPGEPAYLRGVEWGGICFLTYNLVAFLFSFVLLMLVRRFSAKWIHFFCLACGALGFLSVKYIQEPKLLLLSMVGVGIAWASILAMPYAMLSNSIPEQKMGFYMGVFNFFITLPQIVTALTLGWLIQAFFGGESMNALLLGGFSLVIAMLFLLRVEKSH